MGVLNLTPDSFSDGGKYNKKNKGYNHAVKLFKSGSNIIIMQLSYLNQDQILLMLEENLLVQRLKKLKLIMNGIELKKLFIN